MKKLIPFMAASMVAVMFEAAAATSSPTMEPAAEPLFAVISALGLRGIRRLQLLQLPGAAAEARQLFRTRRRVLSRHRRRHLVAAGNAREYAEIWVRQSSPRARSRITQGLPDQGIWRHRTVLTPLLQFASGKCDGIAEFVIVWRNRNGSWQITRLLSYEHRSNT
jgi:hypothetical protein